MQAYGYGHDHGRGGALSFDITVKVEGADLPAKIVFTELGAIYNGCSKENLGDVFTGYCTQHVAV